MAMHSSTIKFQNANSGFQLGVNHGIVNLASAGDSPKTLAEISHLRLRDVRMDGTCDWLLGRDEFTKWAHSPSQFSALLVHGRIGCGKSTLISRVIDWLKEKRHIHLLYFYIDASDYRPKTLRDVLLVLLEQLSTSYTPNYKTCDEIRDNLHTVLARTDQPVYIVIDALDRLSTSDQDWLLKQFFQRCRANSRIAVLITSTDSEALKDLDVTEKLEIQVGGNENANDIRKYVEKKLRQAKTLPLETDDIINRVSKKLTERADGMFLWAELQVASICRNKTKTGILESLEHLTLPDRITDMYDKIVDGFESEPETDRKIAKRAVAILTYATRLIPARAFLVGLAVGRADRQSESHSRGICKARTVKDERLQNVNEKLLSELERDPKIVIQVCKGLVKIDEQVGVFRFCHTSMYDYFKKNEPKWSGPLVADISLSYLCSLGLSEGPCKNASWYNPEPLERYLQDYPLLEFASCHWVSATRMSYEESRDRLVEFCRRPQNMQLSFQVLSLAEREPMVTDMCPAHIVSYFGLVDFFEELSAKGLLDPLQSDGHGLTAIHWAIKSETDKSYAMVKKLIDHGADVNAKDTTGRTPLYYASRNGKLNVVELLLERGAEVNAQNEKHYTALMVASSKGHESIVRKLIMSNADVNIASDIGTALHAAASSGAEKCVSMILKKGRLKLNVDGDRFGTPLHTAAFYGHHQIVKELLDHGFNVNKKSEEFGSTLAAAAAGCYEAKDSSPYMKTFQVLIESGVKVNARGGLHGTALYAAAAYGHIDLVKLLLDKGAVVDAQGPLGTPYQIAKYSGYSEVMQLLEDRGADINASSDDYAASIYDSTHTSLNRAWILAFRVALAANDESRIDSIVTSYEKVLERCIEQGQNNIVEWMTSVGGGVFNVVIALATKGHTPETEEVSKNRIPGEFARVRLLISHRLSRTVCISLPRRARRRRVSSKPSMSSRTDFERFPILDRLTGTGMSILSCSIECNNRRATKIIANMWITALHNVMVQGSYGKKLLEILIKSRVAELTQILTRTEEEEFDRLREAGKLVRVAVELLATAFMRGPEFRPMVLSLSQLWAAALNDIENLEGHHHDVEHLISTFVAEFRDSLEMDDREKVELWAEVGIEITKMVAAGSAERVLDIVVCKLAEMWQEVTARGMENLLDDLVDRRRKEHEELIKNNQHDEANNLWTMYLRLLDAGLRKGSGTMVFKLTNGIITTLQWIKKQAQKQETNQQQEQDYRQLIDSAARVISTGREKGEFALLGVLTGAFLDTIETLPSVAQRISRNIQDIQRESDHPSCSAELARISVTVAHLLYATLMRNSANSQTREALINSGIALFGVIKDRASSEEDKAVVTFLEEKKGGLC